MARRVTRYNRRRRNRKPKRGGSSAVVLQPHQIIPTHRLVTTDTPGLCLWYGMGTGKTLSAITLILNYPDRVVNIVCPHELTYLWETEIQKVPQVTNKIRYYTYEHIDTLFARDTLKDELLIMDEVHNICVKFRTGSHTKKHISLLRTSYKRLLLTGTPMYEDIIDFVYIINLTRQTDLLPYNYTDLTKRYYAISAAQSFRWGILAPAFLTASLNVGTIQGIIAPYFAATTVVLIKNINYIGCTWITYSHKNRINWNTATLTEQKQYFLNYMELVKDWYPADMTFELQMTFIATVLFVIWAYTVFVVYSKSKTLGDLGKFNVDKFSNDIEDSVMFFTVKTDPDKLYPTKSLENHAVSYSGYQVMKWIELTQKIMGLETIYELGVLENSELDSYAKRLDHSDYITYGVAVGNLTDKTSGEYSPKFEEVLGVMKGKRAVIYSQFVSAGTTQFIEFLKSKDKSFLFFDKGLSVKEKSHILDTFANANGECFLVLHPTYTEGVSILGAEQLHILEPIAINSKYLQLIARVVRFKSHAHLPPEKRHVEIHQWISSMSHPEIMVGKAITSLSNMFRTFLESYKVRLRHNIPMFMTTGKYEAFDRGVTPDEQVFMSSSKQRDDEDRIMQELKHTNTDIDCCITYPNAEQEETCRKTRKSCR